MWAQRELTLKARVRRCLFRSAHYRRLIEAQRRGCHLVTDEIARAVPELRDVAVGLAHLFLKHTSASLSINENCDPDVREDMETTLNRLVPDDTRLYTHTAEGPDDMPAHVKSSLFGCQLTVPITDGRLNLGTWQGVYLCEHRDHGGARKLVVTVQGMPRGEGGPGAGSGGTSRR